MGTGLRWLYSDDAGVMKKHEYVGLLVGKLSAHYGRNPYLLLRKLFILHPAQEISGKIFGLKMGQITYFPSFS